MSYALDMERQEIANKAALPVDILFCDWKEGRKPKGWAEQQFMPEGFALTDKEKSEGSIEL